MSLGEVDGICITFTIYLLPDTFSITEPMREDSPMGGPHPVTMDYIVDQTYSLLDARMDHNR